MTQNDPSYASYVHTCPACGMLVANLSRACHNCGRDQQDTAAVAEVETGDGMETSAASRKVALLAMTMGAAFAKVASLRGESS